jgi:hypothetical protein
MYSLSLLLILLALVEKLIRTFGYTLSFVSYDPGRLLYMGAVFAIFTSLMLIRQIRNQLTKKFAKD